MITYRTLGYLLLLSSVASSATAADMPLTRIVIPAEFVGPDTSMLDANVMLETYRRPKSNNANSISLIVARYLGIKELQSLSPERNADAVEALCKPFSNVIARSIQAFSIDHAARATLSGNPATRLDWHGIDKGSAVSGVIFCVIVKGELITVQSQFHDPATGSLATKAIESIEIR